MKFNNMFLILIILFFNTSFKAFGWGERGHHLIGRIAAIRVDNIVKDSKEENEKLGDYFSIRSIQFGHLANLPDTSWKNTLKQTKKTIRLNRPTHYIDLEYLLGPVKGDLEKYVSKVSDIPTDYQKLIKQFDQKKSLLDQTENGKKVSVYFDIGTAPWRIQQLSDTMAMGFYCANYFFKNGKLGKNLKKLKLNEKMFQIKFVKNDKSCEILKDRIHALYVANAAGGVLGHFVGDLAQPFHVTANFDGWDSGQGGVHGYFETDIIQKYKFNLENEVLNAVYNKKANDVKLKNKPSIELALELAKRSFLKLNTALDLDKKISVQELGEVIPIGQKSLLDKKSKNVAKRKLISDDDVKKYQELMTDRLSDGANTLAMIWYNSWVKGGSPQLSDLLSYGIPYVFDLDFILPIYDESAAGMNVN